VASLLVDTDVLIDHLRGHTALRTGDHLIHVSVITRCELFAGTSATAVITTLLEPFRELPVDRAIAERAGRIRRETGTRTPDALIAATAIEHQLGLVTRNTKDFEHVRGLRIRKLT
jgi:predicted nucleic acid-binding protein